MLLSPIHDEQGVVVRWEQVIVTSATLDVNKFSEYFGNCPVKEIPVRTHPVNVYHSKTKVSIHCRPRADVTGLSFLMSLVPVCMYVIAHVDHHSS